MLVSVITPVTGNPLMQQAIQSVQDQDYPDLEHLIVIDGREREFASREILTQITFHKVTHVLCLPYATGHHRFQGHRIYGMSGHLAQGDYLVFLDEDNWFDSDHISQLVHLIESQNLEWAYSLRKIVNPQGEFACNDDCESLGHWPTFEGQKHHIDMNCYCLKKHLVLQYAPLFALKHRSGLIVGTDFSLCAALLREYPSNGNTTSCYSVNYRLGSRPESVTLSFFQRGNAVMADRYPQGFPWQQTNRTAPRVTAPIAPTTLADPAHHSLDLEHHPFNPRDCYVLYVQQAYDQLSEYFLVYLDHFSQNTYFSLSPGSQQRLNLFVKTFLDLISQPDYIISDRHALRFVQANLTISNLVAISSFVNTDAYLTMLRQQPNNFVKFLALYSARNQVTLDRHLIFQANAELANLWYSCFLESYRSALLNPVAWNNLQQHLHYTPNTPQDFYQLEDLYFGSTFISSEDDRLLKQRINHSIQNGPLGRVHVINNRPQKQQVAIVSAFWFPRHSVYRILSRLVESLVPDYELTLIHLAKPNSLCNLDTRLFRQVRHVYLEGSTLHLESIQENNFSLAYFPDIGMNPESILLVNLRIAPIQVCGLGHPVSTWGAQIDYFMSGQAVELSDGAEQFYSERLVLLPGSGVIHEKPDYTIQRNVKKRPEILINCSWFAQKINAPLISHLQQIIRQSDRPVVFRFFSSGALTRKNDFLAFGLELSRLLGPAHIELFTPRSYRVYMSFMEEGDFGLDAYPFGGGNTIVDSLYIHKPIITWEGQRWYSRIGSHILRTVGLDELIAHSAAEYVTLALRLIHDDDYRQHLTHKLQQVDFNATLFKTEAQDSFRQAIDWLMQNHHQLQQEGTRAPIVISR